MSNDYTCVTSGSKAYVAGWVKKLNICCLCVPKLSSNVISDEHFLILLRNYSKCKLMLPNINVINVNSYIIQLFNLNFHNFAFKKGGCSTFKNIVMQIIPLHNCSCKKHNLDNIFVNTVCNLLMYSYTNHINRILCKGEQLVTDDPTKLSANTYYKKYSKKRVALQRQNVSYV